MGGIHVYVPYAQRARAKALWVMTRGQYRRLSRNVKREVCEYIGQSRPEVLCSALKELIIVYDFAGKRGFKLPLETDFGEGVVCCPVDSGSVLFVGGTKPTSQAHLVLFKLEAVVSLAPCPVSLSHPGLILHDNSVYIFGGSPPEHRSCEQLCFPSPHWRSLRPMTQPRSHFSPCAFRQYIYLTDLLNSRRIEAFDTVSERYKSVKLDFVIDPDYSISWTDQGEIVLLTQDEVVTWQPGGSYTSGLFVQCNQEVLTYCPPVVHSGRTFWVYKGELMVFERDLRRVRTATVEDLKSINMSLSV